MKKSVIIGVVVVIAIIAFFMLNRTDVKINSNYEDTKINGEIGEGLIYKGNLIGSCRKIRLQDTLEGCTEYWGEKIGANKCDFSDNEYYKYEWSTAKCPTTENLADICKIHYVKNPKVQHTLFIYKTDYLTENSIKTTCDSLQSSQNQGTIVAEYISSDEL